MVVDVLGVTLDFSISTMYLGKIPRCMVYAGNPHTEAGYRHYQHNPSYGIDYLLTTAAEGERDWERGDCYMLKD